MSSRKRRLDEYEIVDKLGSLSNKRTRLEQVPEEGVEEKKKQLASIEDYGLFTHAYSCYTLKQDEFYENVNVVQSLRIHSAVKNTSTYCITFEASLPADNTTQTFITKISLSFPDPILSSANMGFHYVKIKGEENDYEEEEEEEQEDEDNLSDYTDDPESEVEDPPQENLPKFHKKDSQENLSGFSDGVHSKDSIGSYSESDGKHSENSLFKFAKEQSEDSGKSLSKSDEKHPKDSGESPPKSDEKHSKDFQENLSETNERYSKDLEENLSKFCDGEPSKDSGENLSKFDNEKHSKDSKENLS